MLGLSKKLVPLRTQLSDHCLGLTILQRFLVMRSIGCASLVIGLSLNAQEGRPPGLPAAQIDLCQVEWKGLGAETVSGTVDLELQDLGEGRFYWSGVDCDHGFVRVFGVISGEQKVFWDSPLMTGLKPNYYLDRVFVRVEARVTGRRDLEVHFNAVTGVYEGNGFGFGLAALDLKVKKVIAVWKVRRKTE